MAITICEAPSAETVTMEPPPERAISGAAALAQRRPPLRLVSSARSRSASVVSLTGSSAPLAALLIRMSKRPTCCSISSNIRSTWSARATEARKMSTFAPRARSSSRVCLACSCEWK